MTLLKPNRNDICPCGSSKKYKHCCERKAGREAVAAEPTASKIDQLSALFAAGKLVEMEQPARLLTEQAPDLGMAWKLLGASLSGQGKGKVALRALLKAAALLPNDAEVHNDLGRTLQSLGLLNDAAVSYRKAIAIKSDFANAHNNLGFTLYLLGRFDDSAISCRQAIALRPDFAAAHNNLGNALNESGNANEALASYRKTLQINPNIAEVHNNLGNALRNLGGFDEALVSYRRTIEIKPDLFAAHSNLLFALNNTTHTSADYLAEALRYGENVAKKVTARFTRWQCAPQPQCLRVGMVSGDFHNHPVGYYLEGLLAQLDPSQVELIAYPTRPIEDDLTARIKPYFKAWKPLFALNDNEAAKLIHADGVHLLLDLSGHTAANRLPVFAWKPAPVQVTWLGYFASTGVVEMDYLLADAYMAPKQDEPHFSEKIWRLPNRYLCLTPPDVALEIKELPALANHQITFGCFNALTKMNDAVVALWARVLLGVPHSTLFLKTKQLNDADVRDATRRKFSAHGISPDRLLMEGSSPRAELLAAYQRVDIALDPFPYTGGTSSMEALWMGVPVLTKCGDRFLSRMGESIMHHAGLPDWVANDDDDYVAKAVMHASNLARLSGLHAGLRRQVLALPLFEAQHFARHFEEALWGMWQAGSSSIDPSRFNVA